MTDAELVIYAEQRLAAAHLSLDLATIAALLHDDYVIVQPGGRVERKTDVLASYASGERHWDAAAVEGLDVKIYGENVARVLGVWRASGTNRGEKFDYQAGFVSIWVKEAGEWQNLSYASASIE
jgi:ketosteroid isomerase-like protein